MPTTECRCKACGHSFVHLTFAGDRIEPVCPRCKGRDVNVSAEPVRLMDDPGMGSRLAGVPKGPS
jgi:putative FmdB family regulatory protein